MTAQVTGIAQNAPEHRCWARRPRAAPPRLAQGLSVGVIAALLVVLLPCLALADERVAFHAADPNRTTIGGFLAKPEGSGPFPAVVLLHTCLGLPANRAAIEASLAAAGYVALFVDNFSARGLKETCSVDFPQAVGDAYGALAFLAARPDVDAKRVAVVGFSQGADAALALAAHPSSSDGLRFRAAAAFYPPCANQSQAAAQIPTLILIGEADAVTPAKDCRALAGSQPKAVRLVVYPGAAHGFDDPEFRADKPVLGMTLAYDPAAARKAKAELKVFLAAELGK